MLLRVPPCTRRLRISLFSMLLKLDDKLFIPCQSVIRRSKILLDGIQSTRHRDQTSNPFVELALLWRKSKFPGWNLSKGLLERREREKERGRERRDWTVFVTKRGEWRREREGGRKCTEGTYKGAERGVVFEPKLNHNYQLIPSHGVWISWKWNGGWASMERGSSWSSCRR